MRKQMLTPALSLLFIAFGTVTADAQGRAQYAGEGDYSATSLWVTATVGKDHIRFASLGIGQRMRLEILNQAGDRIFDSDSMTETCSTGRWRIATAIACRTMSTLAWSPWKTWRTIQPSPHFPPRSRRMARFESLEASNTSAAASSEGQDIVTILRTMTTCR